MLYQITVVSAICGVAGFSQFYNKKSPAFSHLFRLFHALCLYSPMCCRCRYSTIYTMFPVFSLVLDKDVKSEVAMLYPELYKDLLKVTRFITSACHVVKPLRLRLIWVLRMQQLQSQPLDVTVDGVCTAPAPAQHRISTALCIRTHSAAALKGTCHVLLASPPPPHVAKVRIKTIS